MSKPSPTLTQLRQSYIRFGTSIVNRQDFVYLAELANETPSGNTHVLLTRNGDKLWLSNSEAREVLSQLWGRA